MACVCVCVCVPMCVYVCVIWKHLNNFDTFTKRTKRMAKQLVKKPTYTTLRQIVRSYKLYVAKFRSDKTLNLRIQRIQSTIERKFQLINKYAFYQKKKLFLLSEDIISNWDGKTLQPVSRKCLKMFVFPRIPYGLPVRGDIF